MLQGKEKGAHTLSGLVYQRRILLPVDAGPGENLSVPVDLLSAPFLSDTSCDCSTPAKPGIYDIANT